MSIWKVRKRVFTSVSVHDADGAFEIALDDNRLDTPAGNRLSVATRALADVLGAEWEAQPETLQLADMPMSRFAATVVDRIQPNRDAIVEIVVGFAATDLLCYRDDRQPELAALQEARWQPLLDWAAETLGARLRVTEGVVPVGQPAESLDAIRAAVGALDDFRLAAVAAIAAASASAVLALALNAGRIDAAEAAALALLDERYQMERWGEDAEALDRHRRMQDEIADAARFLDLL